MDTSPLSIKCLAIEIILLFVGSGMIPSTAQDGEKSSLYFRSFPANTSTIEPVWNFSITTTGGGNNPPYTPSNPNPPNQAIDVDINIDLSWTGGDPDASDVVTYDVYFGNMLPLEKVASNISTTSYNPGTLHNGLRYFWNIVAWDNYGLSADGPRWRFTTIALANHPPNKPSRPSGQTNGKIGQQYSYTTSTPDPDGDQVYYLWDWGDGSTSGWLGPYNCGVAINTTHKWTVKSSFSIKVKAKDVFNAESVWSNPLPITMPYTYKPILQVLELFFQRFPNTFPPLRLLLEY
jgi:hypothetical protein